jgi:3'-phosphoadenosine 5'-phosphosulfate sulfotransferase (PAPS reductase)/FAD synthetase
MEKILHIIKESLRDARNPALLCSFGKDSLLLLFLTLKVRPDISIIWFKQRASDDQRKFAEKIIKDWNLTVLSYAPIDSYFVPNDEGLTLIDEMSFGAVNLPLLTDTAQGSICAIHVKDEQTPFFDYGFDVTLFGYKAVDKHSIIENKFPSGFDCGNTRFLAPLWNLTDEEVLQAIQDLQIPYEQFDDSLSICTRCLKSNEPVFCPEVRDFISPVQWQPEERLQEFRARFQGGNNQGHGLSP